MENALTVNARQHNVYHGKRRDERIGGVGYRIMMRSFGGTSATVANIALNFMETLRCLKYRVYALGREFCCYFFGFGDVCCASEIERL